MHRAAEKGIKLHSVVTYMRILTVNQKNIKRHALEDLNRNAQALIERELSVILTVLAQLPRASANWDNACSIKLLVKLRAHVHILQMGDMYNRGLPCVED